MGVSSSRWVDWVSRNEKWSCVEFGGLEVQLINLNDKQVEQVILDEMGEGMDVYYDTRWEATSLFCGWLAEDGLNREFVQGRQLLIPGAGLGAESILLAREAEMIYLNDLSEVALDMAAVQLQRNGLSNYQLLPGDYNEITIPAGVDLAVGSFLVYNDGTLRSMRRFLETFPGELVLVNERLKPFRKFLDGAERPIEKVFEMETADCVRFSG